MMNPTGGTATGGPILSMPMTSNAVGSPGNFNFGNVANPTPPMPSEGTNPYGPTNVVAMGAVPPSNSTFGVPPPTSMNPGGPTATSTVTGQGGQTVTNTNPYGQTQSQQNRTLGELQSEYGEGMGSLLYQYITSGGGYNSGLTSQAVNAQIQAMQSQITQGYNTLGTDLAESGISPNSSVAALEKSNYMSQATAQENAITAQEYYNMWNQSQNREESILGQTGQVSATQTANQPGVLGQISNFLGLGQTAASGASAITSAVNPGADTSFLDAIAAF